MIAFILWLLCAYAGYKIGSERKMGPIIGFFLGLILSILGVIIVLVSPKNQE